MYFYYVDYVDETTIAFKLCPISVTRFNTSLHVAENCHCEERSIPFLETGNYSVIQIFVPDSYLPDVGLYYVSVRIQGKNTLSL